MPNVYHFNAISMAIDKVHGRREVWRSVVFCGDLSVRHLSCHVLLSVSVVA